MVLQAVMFMNAFVDKKRISDEYSPRELILRLQLDWKRHRRYQFGDFGKCMMSQTPPKQTHSSPGPEV